MAGVGYMNLVDPQIAQMVTALNKISNVIGADAVEEATVYSLKSEGWAVGKQNGTDVGSGSPYYHNNSKYYAELASQTVASKADKSGTVLDTTLSRGRKSGTTAGTGSLAFGSDVEANGNYTSAFGEGTIANHKDQHVFGEYNVADHSAAAASARGTYAEIVGNGTSDSNRSNARTLDWAGNEELAGGLKLGRHLNLPVLTGVTTGAHASTVGTAGSASADYVPSNWVFDTDLTPQNGDIIFITVPVAGISSGVWLSVDNGTTFNPIATNGIEHP